MGDSFSPTTNWGLKERGGAAIMASLQLRLDCTGVSLQRLCSLDRITVLSNSSKYNLAVPLTKTSLFCLGALTGTLV